MECPKCGATYRLQRSDETGQTVRNICRCEQARVCGYQKRGKASCGDVLQAFLDPDNLPEMYVCENHAAHDCIDEMAPPKAKATRTKAASEERREPRTVEEYKAFISVFDDEMICLGCKTRHPYRDRVPKITSETPKAVLFEMHCPKCGVGEYFAEGPPWKRTYVSSDDYDNPKPEHVPEKPVLTKKRK
jgi:predicted nucleic-acid-binding Zn-ribbon protein